MSPARFLDGVYFYPDVHFHPEVKFETPRAGCLLSKPQPLFTLRKTVQRSRGNCLRNCQFGERIRNPKVSGKVLLSLPSPTKELCTPECLEPEQSGVEKGLV